MMLGIVEEAVYEGAKVQIAHGETLVLYTDGVTEAESAEGKFSYREVSSVGAGMQ